MLTAFHVNGSAGFPVAFNGIGFGINPEPSSVPFLSGSLTLILRRRRNAGSRR